MTVFLYGLFFVRFILSWVVGDADVDTDTDADFDADADVDGGDSGLSWSDIVTFKGATHFGMGFFGWLSSKQYLSDHIAWYDWFIAIIIGLIFTIVLYFVYYLLLKLESKPVVLSGTKLIGSRATIHLILPKNDDYYRYSITVFNGVGTVEVEAKSKKEYSIGSITSIINFENQVYLI